MIRASASKPLREHGMRILNSLKRSEANAARKKAKAENATLQAELAKKKEEAKKNGTATREANKKAFTAAKKEFNEVHSNWKDDVSKYERFCLSQKAANCVTAWKVDRNRIHLTGFSE